MAQPGILILLDGSTIARIRGKRWTRQGFDAVSGVSVNEIADIEKMRPTAAWPEGRPVSMRTAKKIVDALKFVDPNVSIDSLRRGWRYPSEALAYHELAGVSKNHQEQLKRARDCDMAGNYPKAIAISTKVRRQIGKSEFVPWARVTIRLATFLDNAGLHETDPKARERLHLQALDELNWRDKPWLKQIPEQLRDWAAYHRAIAHRRLGQLAAAARELDLLLAATRGQKETNEEHPKADKGELWTATKYQMGVICLERSTCQDEKFLDQALSHLNESQKYWHEQGNHREGFSLRRRAQVHSLKTNYPEAIRDFFAAIEIFARCRARRYVEETSADLEHWVLSRVRILKK